MTHSPTQTKLLSYEPDNEHKRYIVKRGTPLGEALKELRLKRQLKGRIAGEKEMEAFKKAKALVEAEKEETLKPIDLKAEIKRIIDKAASTSWR